MMFGFLKKLLAPPLRIVPRKFIWLNDRACHAAFHVYLEEALRRQNVLIVAHFSDDLEAIRDELLQQGTHFEVVSQNVSPAEIMQIFTNGSENSVVLALSKFLQPADSLPNDSTAPAITVIVQGMHPLPQYDQRITNFTQSFGTGSELKSNISLEHPATKFFGGERVGNTLQKMGMKESEAIESRMVARRMETAQQKIAKSATTDYEASSAEAWLARNWPNAR